VYGQNTFQKILNRINPAVVWKPQPDFNPVLLLKIIRKTSGEYKKNAEI
jgi:hypothetical protein